MKQKNRDEEEIRQYLVGEIPESEIERIESRLIADQEYFRRLELVEGELADDYVRGELSGAERKRYENRSLSTVEGVEEVRLAAGLREVAEQEAKQSRPKRPSNRTGFASRNLSPKKYSAAAVTINSYILAGAIVACLLIISTLAIRVFILQNRLDQSAERLPSTTREVELQEQVTQQRAEMEQLKEIIRDEQNLRQEAEQQLAVLRRSDQSGNANTSVQNHRSTLGIVLPPGSLRGSGERKRIVITPDLETVQIQLVLHGKEYENYKAVLQDETGKEILTRVSLKPERVSAARRILLRIPASLLIRGDYVVRLSGAISQNEFEEIGSYYFQVATQ